MNTQQSTVTHLLDNDWITVVEEHLQAYPTAVAMVIEPQILGQYHAQLGLPCNPYHYTRPSDWDDYLVAYVDTVSLWAEMVEAKNDEARGIDYEAELMEETLEYVEDMLDREFWARGQY